MPRATVDITPAGQRPDEDPSLAVRNNGGADPSAEPAPAGRREALLVLSFGGPEGHDDVMPFLENVTRGRGIPRERLEAVSHHYQALVMSRMAPTRSSDQDLIALAGQIEVEQDLEIMMMQSWQSWNGLDVTDAETAYNELLQDPMMLEQMGMATPAQLDALSAAQGNDFDILYLQLMIRHHEGALDMIDHVLTHGSDEILAQWANDMLVTQQTQIFWMEDMLAGKT